MSSLLSDNEDAQHLDLFLVNFPDTDTHVKLRKQANGIFKVFDLDVESGEEGEEYDDEDGGGRHRRNNKYHNRIHGLFGDKQNSLSDSEPEDIKGFDINEEKLTERFNLEAREELADLFAQRRKLLGEVTEQKVLLQSFTKDIYHLSKGKDGMDSEFFAIELTKDVNRFAREHQLRLSRMLETATAENIEEVADGFLSRFGKGRPDARDVGTQVTDQDLGYMDEGVQQAESRLNDLYFHEKGLIDAIKLATVAVANIMSFHASLELESTCKECFYIFESPRTLWPCGHTFCLPCLSGMYNRNEELICAECGSLCETGYTPNLTIELVSNYQLIREVNPTGAAPKGKGKTIESVLRNLLADLVSTQHNYTVPAVPSKSPQRISFE
ncbi:Zinc finger, C3HC4 type (RING finger) containing protein, putative [Angomonas deanei]|uniref:Zinc finger, C3HC4 type (RING finger) containing protein, putative n=1 Tax=Angomonas deanei TaxID=59799 RepID=A0A7G2CHA5_9TRYP|nr:Zinc finger, C3HC4 type (RING finger) containing protein, putative [Angomonas deanei]